MNQKKSEGGGKCKKIIPKKTAACWMDLWICR